MKPFKVSLVHLDDVSVPAWVPEKLKREGVDLFIQECHTPEELIQVAQDADVVWLLGGKRILSPEILRLLPRCGAILRSGSGTDNVPVNEATRLGMIVANTPEAQHEQVTDHTLALLFSVVRQIANNDRLMRTGSMGACPLRTARADVWQDIRLGGVWSSSPDHLSENQWI